LQATGMARVARAIDPIPDAIYNAADVLGIIYYNPLIEARLVRYPGFLSIGLRPEFQTLGQDESFKKLRVAQKPIREMLAHPTVDPIVNNPDTLKLIWNTLLNDLNDASNYLWTAKSAKYDSELILGRWLFDVNGTVSAFRRTRANVPLPEALRFRRVLTERFTKTTLVASPDNQVVIRNLPALATEGVQTLDGTWKKSGDEYELDLGGGSDQRTAKIENYRMAVSSSEGWPLVFVKEDY
jgi:hypothetical protein